MTTAPAGSDRGRFGALDSVRGLASVTVVINHCLNVFPLFGGSSAGAMAPQPGVVVAALLGSPLSLVWDGRSAVALFFVLSGFVLALPWFGGRALRYRLFVPRRFCRIYLPYAVAIGAAMTLAAWLPPTGPVSGWFDENWGEPAGWVVVRDHLLMLGTHNTFDNVIWSLNHEMRISLVFPLLLLPLLRFGLMGGAVVAVVLYGGAGVITHFAGWHGAPAEAAATMRFGAFFVLGAALARSEPRLRAAGPGHAAWISLVAGLGCLWAGREPAVMAIGSALVILAAILPGRIRRVLDRPWLRALGRVSYSLYLVHLLVLLSAVHLLAGLAPLPVIVAGAFGASFPVAVLFHRWIEAPSDRLGRRLTAHP